MRSIPSCVFVVLLLACEGTRTVRGTSGATGSGPDFNGSFDRRPLQAYTRPDAGTAYEWPTSIPDGWTVESGAWGRGVFALYGEGYGGGTPIMCTAKGGELYPCPGTGAFPNNSALSEGVCWSYNGGCGGFNALRSMNFQITGGSSYALSVFVHGRVDFSDFSGTFPMTGLVFQIDWLSGASMVGTERIPDDSPLAEEWVEHRFAVDAPANATNATIRIELARTKRDIRLDNVALVPQ